MASEAQTRLSDLIDMRDSGLTESVVDGQVVKFRSDAELTKAIQRLRQQLGQQVRRRGTRTLYMGRR